MLPRPATASSILRVTCSSIVRGLAPGRRPGRSRSAGSAGVLLEAQAGVADDAAEDDCDGDRQGDHRVEDGGSGRLMIGALQGSALTPNHSRLQMEVERGGTIAA